VNAEETKPSDTKNDEFLKAHGEVVFRSSKNARQWVEDRWVKSNKLYDSEFSEEERKYSDYLGTQRLFVPKTYANTQRIIVEGVDAFYDDPDEIVQIGSDKSVPFEVIQTVKTVMNYRLNSHPIDFYKVAYEGVMDAVKNKICVLNVFPKLKTEKVMKQYVLPHPDTMKEETYQVPEEQITAYEPDMLVLPPEDVFFASSATWVDYWKHAIVYRYKRTRDELKRKGFKNVDTVQASTAPTDEVKVQRLDRGQSPFSEDTNVKAAEYVYCYAIWTHMPGEDGELESGSFIMLGSEASPSVIGRGWERNELPYKFSEFEPNRPPIVLGVAFPESHKLYGKDFPEITESLQKETNAQRNQEREAVARALRPPTYINRDANVDLASLLNRRIGGYVQGDGPGNEAMLEMPTMNPSFITAQHQARTDNDYYEASGIPPDLLGITGNQEKTATQSTQQLSNANKKIALIIKNIAFTAFIPAFRYLLRLEQTYGNDGFVQMVTGKSIGIGGPQDNLPTLDSIQGEFDVKVNVGMNKQAQFNKFMMISDRIVQANQAMAQLVQMGVANPMSVQFKDPMKILDAGMTILGLKNTEEWNIQAMPPPPQPGEMPGMASQPSLPQDPSQQVANMNPEPTGIMNVL
jgi:hypothetical protein